jgi:hypothetical protein
VPTNKAEVIPSIEMEPPDRSLPSERMTDKTPHTAVHRHSAVVTHLLRQRSGVPYEVERKICSACNRVLDERLLKRAAA